MQVPRCSSSSSSSHHDSSKPDVVRCGFLLAHSCCAVREFCARCSVATFGIMCTITNLDTTHDWAKGIPRGSAGSRDFPQSISSVECHRGPLFSRQVWLSPVPTCLGMASSRRRCLALGGLRRPISPLMRVREHGPQRKQFLPWVFCSTFPQSC